MLKYISHIILLKARGVHFVQETQTQPWGIEALFTDLYGNIFGLHQEI
jgi:hypothetical protein